MKTKLFLNLMFVLTLCAILGGCAGRSVSAPKAEGLIVFMTDFGVRDNAVGICKGVMVGIAPGVQIIDLTHEVPAHDVLAASRLLADSVNYYPAGTVFVGVVDPGVGAGRRAIVAKSKTGHFFVLPDNGFISLVQEQIGIEEIREITNPQWMVPKVSTTFHGRDIFSPVGAHLSRGEDWAQVGPVVTNPVALKLEEPKRVSNGVHGKIVSDDGNFGNLITDIPASEMVGLGYVYGQPVELRIGKKNYRFHFARTFGEVPKGQPLIYEHSNARLALAVNQGNFALQFNVKVPVAIFIYKAEK